MCIQGGVGSVSEACRRERHVLQPILPRSLAMNLSTLLLAAAATFATTTGAQAFQGEQNPLPPAPFKSTLSRAQVQAQAHNPVQISNGSTGVHHLTSPRADRAAVRAGALGIAAEGSSAYGEAAGTML
jgi:hypothetical protein